MYDFVSDSNMGENAVTATFNNAGLLEKTAGTGTSGTLEFLTGDLVNSGTIKGVKTTDSSGDIFISGPAPSPNRAMA